MHRNDADLVECELTIEQLPKSTLRQLEPDSAPPYQPPRCWLPGEHTGGPKEGPQPSAPQRPLSSAPTSALNEVPPCRHRPYKYYLQEQSSTGKPRQPIEYIYTYTQYPCLDAHSEQLSNRSRKPLQTRRRSRVRGSGREMADVRGR